MSLVIFCGCVKDNNDEECTSSTQQEEQDRISESNQEKNNENTGNINNEEDKQTYKNSYNEQLSFSEVKEGNFENYSIKKETYNFNNDKSTSIKISYPSVQVNNNKEVSDKINEAIKKAAFYNYNEEKIKNEYNINIIVDYTIVYHDQNIISIYFSGQWIKGSLERGLSISLKDGSIENLDSFGVSKNVLQNLMKTENIIVNNIDFIAYLRKENKDIANYIYNEYINYNDEVYNCFVDDKNIYIVATLEPVHGYGITLKILYEWKIKS